MPTPSRAMTGAEQVLAAAYVPQALGLARPYGRAWPSLGADFDSAAQLALCEAAMLVDGRDCAQFTGYLRNRVTWAALDLIRNRMTNDRHRHRLAERQCARCIPDRAAAAAARDEAEWLLARLTPRRARCLRLRYYDDLDVAATAVALGQSETTARRDERAALDYLRGLREARPCP